MALTKQTQFVATYENAPFFDRAFCYGVQHGLIDQARIGEIIEDAAKGTPQVTEYFGASAHLRINLEESTKRMVHLASLYLEDATDGDVDQAARLVQEKSFRSLSRGGSNMLKFLNQMPESASFGFLRINSEKEFLATQSLAGMTAQEYRLQFKERALYQREISFASWLANKFGIPVGTLRKIGEVSADRVIRTALLLLAYAPKKVGAGGATYPDKAEVYKIFTSIRKEWDFLGDVTCARKFLENIPEEFAECAQATLTSIEREDIPKIVSQSTTTESVFASICLKYFFTDEMSDDGMSVGVSTFDKMLAEEWFSLTGGTEEDALLLTLFLCAASGFEPATELSMSEAKRVVLSVREHGLQEMEVPELIEKAPHDERDQLLALWEDFIEDARPYLMDKSDDKFKQVMPYLVEHCNIQPLKKKVKSKK